MRIVSTLLLGAFLAVSVFSVSFAEGTKTAPKDNKPAAKCPMNKSCKDCKCSKKPGEACKCAKKSGATCKPTCKPASTPAPKKDASK